MTAQHIRIGALALSAALLSSCLPPLTPYEQSQPLTAADPGLDGTGTVDDPAHDQLTDRKREVAEGGTEATGTEGTTPSAPNGGGNGANQAGKPNYPYALPIPGKDGFVFNPYTNNPVDVRGIPSGTLVRDPQDPNADHKFRVP
mgnify:CR=1 FL=1